MEYTVHKLGHMAGISTRTLRYYDQIDLLKPARTNSSGYRIYGQPEVDRLQQILFFRELGVSLDIIKEIMTSPSFDGNTALREHRAKLLKKRAQLDQLIANVDSTLAHSKGGITMTNEEKFDGFKQTLIDDNEKNYGNEIRAKYGDESINLTNQKMMNMTETQYADVEQLEACVHEALAKAMITGDPASEPAQHAVDLHRQWLSCYWTTYSKEAHAGLAQMYVDDERFTAYYDVKQPGTAAFLRDAILIYTA
ncbi:MerR family transcriptional regulator [Paenibacillus macquariensis]|uniref:DNA-binding transcriptional regulator, MerR family n=1 Tax=Paenibacillus macquariensis TaxID=948756 RepID=A0ABY1K360_9BACL|nr:MerR family transcriptional regulator [Paenibacillus macquariensis]MEC0090328.1 MerR family transcriptional regulator [Paenibacillus macquariensis]OAB39683.1 MerR family transcriptional regulator [Paenibacillus macquariensis subsp. macquariensis]SIR19508.1 DNA-binding transcriptional regulator, MerR family [Paenibacillus macquariensis]